jgi:hypothetical protein
MESVMGFVRRRTRRRTALLVGGAAYAAGAAGRRGEPDYDEGADQTPPPAPPAPAPTSEGPDTDELERLGQLHADGTLTDEEFAAAKAKILGT